MIQIAGKAVKKPVQIDWFLFRGWSVPHMKELMTWVQSFGQSFYDVVEVTSAGRIKIKTLEGSSYSVPDGYIIIRGVKGEFYPCDPEIFNETYEIEKNLFS